MKTSMLLSIIMAATAYTLISLGLIMMKRGIDWIGWKGEKNGIYYKNLAIWVFGFIIMNIYGIPTVVALKRLPPHIVSAFAGWGIIVLVFLAYFILKEKLFSSDFIFSIIIIIFIILLNVFKNKNSIYSINILWLTVISIFPFFLFIGTFLFKIRKKVRTVVFSIVAGASAGMMVVYLSILVLLFKYDIKLYLNSLYLYLYLFFALLSFIALQIAMKNGDMIIIGQIQYSSNIIYPIFATLFVFQNTVSVFSFVAIFIIAYSVKMILKKH